MLLADECGLGKTITAIEVAKRVRGYSWVGWLGMVVVPLSLRGQWEDMLNEQDPSVPVMFSDYIPWDYLQLNGWVIVTYPELQGNAFTSLVKVVWDIIIVDEAHRIKNRKTASAVNIKKIPAARKLALTGTPWEKSAGDVWSILNFLLPGEFQSYWTFAKEWLELLPNYFEHFQYGGPLNPEEFSDMLSRYMIRRTKQDVRKDMPEKVLVETRVDMLLAQQNRYDSFKAAQDVLVEVDDQEFLIKNILAQITLLQQLSTDPEMVGLKGTSGKLLWLKEFLEDHPTENVVIFSRFRAVVEKLAKQYKGDLIVGGERGTDFIEGRNRLLFGTIEAMGEGLNLQRGKYAIFLDSHWSTIRMTQAIDRIHRINIDEDKVIYLLHSCAEDELVLDALDHKWTEAELVYHFLHPD